MRKHPALFLLNHRFFAPVPSYSYTLSFLPVTQAAATLRYFSSHDSLLPHNGFNRGLQDFPASRPHLPRIRSRHRTNAYATSPPIGPHCTRSLFGRARPCRATARFFAGCAAQTTEESCPGISGTAAQIGDQRRGPLAC